MKLLYEKETYEIRGACFEVYKNLRNYHKESVYHNALVDELKSRELNINKNQHITISYKEKKVGTYVPDLVVNDLIIIELKCKPFLHKDDLKQFWHYLKNSNYKIGFLINFGALDGVQIQRFIYTPSA